MKIILFLLISISAFGQDFAAIAEQSARQTDRVLGLSGTTSIEYTTPTACACDFTVTADQVLDNATMGVKPGQTVCFKPGTYSWLYIKNFKGEPGKPITFINECSGKVIFKRGDDGQRIVWAINDQYVRWTGTGSPSEFYGFEFIGGGQGIDFRERSSDIEFDHCYGHDIGYSFFNAKTDPVCGKPETQRGGFTMYNILYHDNKAVNIRTGEAAYVGESHYAAGFKAVCGLLQEHDVYGAKFFNNIFENIGRDAIQIGGCLEGMEVYNNQITNYGMTKEYGQGSGITQNPGSKGEIHDNTIMWGSGFGICAQGRGGTKIYRNLIVGTGTPIDGGGIMTVTYAPTDPAPYDIYQNTLVNINRVSLEYYGATSFHNNLTVGLDLKKKGGSAGVLTEANNKQLLISQLDTSYVPVSASVVPAGTGYKDFAPSPPIITREAATIEVVTTDGVPAYYLVLSSGKRIQFTP